LRNPELEIVRVFLFYFSIFEIKIFSILSRKKIIYSSLIIIVISVLSFSNSIKNNFVNWDDDILVLNNDDIKSLKKDNFSAFFSNYYVGHYHPLTMISYAIDYGIGELKPKVYHIHNLILHILNSILLLLIFFHFFKRIDIALLLVLLFAVHPLKVESVSWISERKDLLYSFYYLGGILSYLYYLKNDRKIKYIILCFILFILALLSKTSAVTLPVILLLIDYYYKPKAFLKSILEKIPFFIVSIAFGIFTIYILKESDAIYDISDKYNFVDRLFLPFYAIAFYIVKLFVPFDLSASYFFTEKINGLLPWYYYASPIVIVIAIFLIKKTKEIRKELIFGFLFFLISIFLFLQILPSGRVIVADRYAYIPYIGLLFIIGKLFLLKTENKKGKKNKRTYISIIVIFIIVFIFQTRERNKVWQNGETLFTDIINDYPKNSIGYVNRGIAKYYGFTDNNKIDYISAIKDFNKALSFDLESVKALFNRGNCLYNLNDLNGALNDFNRVIEIDPFHAKAYNNRGLVFSVLNNDNNALSDYNKAIEINPEYSDAILNRGITYFNMNNIEKACNDWKKAAKLNNKRAGEMILNYCKQL